MKRILQIDGGGIRGIIPAIILKQLEQRCRRPLCQCFDLITGTSTGAIIGGAIAAGVAPEKIADLYLNKGELLFKPRTKLNPMNWLRSKYDRQPFIEEIKQTRANYCDNKPLRDINLASLQTYFMATAFNLCSSRTHFLKSWCQEHQKYNIVEVVSWSALSAAYYFGKMTVPDYQWCHYQPGDLHCNQSKRVEGAVFQDGGQGLNNNTLGYILMSILAARWTDEEIYLLSLGTGDSERYIPYEEAAQFHFIKQIRMHSSIRFGCQAKSESIMDQVLATYFVSKDKLDKSNITFKRIDKMIKPEELGLDNIKHIETYKAYGHQLAQQITDSDVERLTSPSTAINPEELDLFCPPPLNETVR